MRLRLVCIGKRMPSWVDEAVSDYVARMPRECPMELAPIAAAKRHGGLDRGQLQQADSEKLIKACRPRERRIVLDERGQHWTTQQLSQQLADWRMEGADVALLIGGADGHSDELRESAGSLWAVSRLTLPHAMVRVMVCEQLYRAWSILQGHPYHRE